MARRQRPSGGSGGHRLPAEPSEGTDDQTARSRHQETLLDEAIEETFPASDPISPMVVN